MDIYHHQDAEGYMVHTEISKPLDREESVISQCGAVVQLSSGCRCNQMQVLPQRNLSTCPLITGLTWGTAMAGPGAETERQ